MADITAVRIILTAPGRQPVEVNCTSAEYAETGTTSAVEEVRVSWSQPTPLDSQDPGTVSLTLVSAAPQPAPWQTEVLVYAAVDGADITIADDCVIIAHGWVTSSRYRPHGELWLTRLVLDDAHARAAGTKLAADATWPQEYTAWRIARIDTAAGWTVTDSTMSEAAAAGGDLPPVKVTNGDTIHDLLEHTLRPIPALLIEGPTGLGARYLHGDAIRWPHTAGPAIVYDTGYLALPLPAAAIGSIWRGEDRAGAITRVRYTTLNGITGDRVETIIAKPGATTGATAELALTADCNYTTAAGQRFRSLMAGLAGKALIALDPGPILLGQIDTETLEELIGIPSRAALAVHITDCPADVDPRQTVTAGELVIAAGLKASLTLALRPTQLCGTRPVQFSDWPTPGDLPPAAGGLTFVAATFANAGVVTFNDLEAIAGPRADRY